MAHDFEKQLKAMLLPGLRQRDEWWAFCEQVHQAEHIRRVAHVAQQLDPFWFASPSSYDATRLLEWWTIFPSMKLSSSEMFEDLYEVLLSKQWGFVDFAFTIEAHHINMMHRVVQQTKRLAISGPQYADVIPFEHFDIEWLSVSDVDLWELNDLACEDQTQVLNTWLGMLPCVLTHVYIGGWPFDEKTFRCLSESHGEGLQLLSMFQHTDEWDGSWIEPDRVEHWLSKTRFPGLKHLSIAGYDVEMSTLLREFELVSMDLDHNTLDASTDLKTITSLAVGSVGKDRAFWHQLQCADSVEYLCNLWASSEDDVLDYVRSSSSLKYVEASSRQGDLIYEIYRINPHVTFIADDVPHWDTLERAYLIEVPDIQVITCGYNTSPFALFDGQRIPLNWRIA